MNRIIGVGCLILIPMHLWSAAPLWKVGVDLLGVAFFLWPSRRESPDV